MQRIAEAPRTLEYEGRLRAEAAESTIVRIDRGEPNKNIVRGFRAYDQLLAQHPELKGRVKFLAFLVPSRTHLRQYQRYMEEVKQTIQQVNKTHSGGGWQPIVPFMENNYAQAIAGMKLYDVLLVNTLVEGMNLVAKEGPVVNRSDGVLVLVPEQRRTPPDWPRALSAWPPPTWKARPKPSSKPSPCRRPSEGRGRPCCSKQSPATTTMTGWPRQLRDIAALL